MNKSLIFIFSLLIFQFASAMDYFKKSQEEYLLIYHQSLVDHFYSHSFKSADDIDTRFVYDNESGFLYETTERKKKIKQDNLKIEKKNLKLSHSINNHRISFFNIKTKKQVDCDLVYQGQFKNLKKEDISILFEKDKAQIVGAYLQLTQ